MDSVVVQPLELTFSSVWMLPPEYRSLRQALKSKGYTLEDKGRGSTVILASKGSIEIFANLERRTIGIGSETSTNDLLVAYEDLEKVYEELGIETLNILFYEFIGYFSTTSTKSPLETMKSLEVGQDIVRKIGNALGKDLAILGLNLAVKHGNPTSSEWLHLSIEPLYASANKRFYVTTICRGKKEDVADFVKRIEKGVGEIIDKVEGSS